MSDIDRIRTAEPRDKQYKLGMGKGLYVLVHPKGGKYWRYKYRINGSEKVLSLGVWPDVNIKTARLLCDEARANLQIHGIDPSAKKQSTRIAKSESFEAIAREWLASGAPTGNRRKKLPKQATIDRMEQRLEVFIFPYIGKKSIKSIKGQDIKRALDRISERGTFDTAHRVRSVVDRVFRYAIGTDRAERNIAADLRGTLTLAETKSHAAITDPKRLGELLRAIDGYMGQPTVMAALKLLPLVFTRPGELRFARWEDIDIKDQLWTIPAERMKNGLIHTVPLATQAVKILQDLYPITGDSELVFPGLRSRTKPISDNTLNAALRSLGYDNKTHVAHGFRTTARTLLDETRFGESNKRFDRDVIEQQLAHKRQGIDAVYNRSNLLEERREMMQEWANYLHELRDVE